MMIDGFYTASILAAFISGAIAFFAPCCVTFLLPAYFAFALKEKTQMVQMTVVFMLGLATVLLPIGLGLAGLGQLSAQFHKEIFIAGGLFLVLVGGFTLAGRSIAMPFKPHTPNIEKLDVVSIYQLGLFSGFASSCCLPVLTGVLTLSFISASFLQAFLLGWAYVFGMVIPLVLFALLWEKYKIGEHGIVRGKIFEINLFGKELKLHSTNLLAGLILIAIGIMTLVIAFTNQITATNEYQLALAVWLQGVQKSILEAASIVPDWVFLILLLAAFALLVKKARLIRFYLNTEKR